MGSKVFKDAKDFYFLGLWLADGYWWSSSVGLSSTNDQFIKGFKNFLRELCPTHNIKERIYEPNGNKRKLTAKHVYVNSRPLTRLFMSYKHKQKLEVPNAFLPAYFAGRIDGDGHVDTKHRTGIRIVYSDKKDAVRDLNLLKRLQEEPASLYRYQKANTWVLYFRKNFLRKIQPKIAMFAFKLKDFCPVETSAM